MTTSSDPMNSRISIPGERSNAMRWRIDTLAGSRCTTGWRSHSTAALQVRTQIYIYQDRPTSPFNDYYLVSTDISHMELRPWTKGWNPRPAISLARHPVLSHISLHSNDFTLSLRRAPAHLYNAAAPPRVVTERGRSIARASGTNEARKTQKRW